MSTNGCTATVGKDRVARKEAVYAKGWTYHKLADDRLTSCRCSVCVLDVCQQMDAPALLARTEGRVRRPSVPGGGHIINARAIISSRL